MPRLPDAPEELRNALADRIAIGAPVGAGASGIVYRATVTTAHNWLAAGETVAIKVLRRGDPAALEQLRREGEIGLGVDDPHVVTIHEAGELQTAEGPLVFLVNEFVEGRTLRDFVREHGPASGDLVRRIGEQAARGLASLHRAGVVHRDLKPENVLITPDAGVRIMDLGLARRTRPDGRTSATLPGPSSGGLFGSVAYAAPEVLRGRPATAASDLYGLGLVLYELATGAHPFGDETSSDGMLHAQLERLPPPPSTHAPDVSPFVDRLLLALLDKDLEQRFDDAAALADTFAAGEASPWWQAHVRTEPVLASRRRLQRMRRFAAVPLVDRDDERALLDQALAEARRGRGGVIVVTGAVGSGRRRLLDEVIDTWLTTHDDVLFLGAVATGDPAAPSGTPFPQLLVDALLPGEDPAALRIAERLAARIRAHLGTSAAEAETLATAWTAELGARTGESVALRAARIVDALDHLASRAAALVIRIDRSEELDQAGQRVVQLLAERAVTRPILALLVPARGAATPLASARTLRVAPLTRDAFTELGRRLFRGGAAPEELLAAAWSPLSGNPRALLESLDELVGQGRLLGRPGDYRELSASVTELAPAPPALQRLRRHIVGLPRDHGHVLLAAAVLGDEFRVTHLATLTGRTELQTLEALAAAGEEFVAAEGGVGRFRHRDFRLATLNAAAPDARRRLHRSAAWVLEDLGAPALEVGLHLSRALEHAACIRPLLAGLEQLVTAGSRRRALRVVERLHLHLNALPRTGPLLDARLAWLLLAGTTHGAVGRVERATRDFRKAILIADHLGRSHERARALVGLADLAQAGGRFLAAVGLLDDAEQALADDPSDAGRTIRAHALLVQGRVMAYLGQSRDALRLTARGLREAPESAAGLRVHLLVDHARWQAVQLRFLVALDNLDEAEALLPATDDGLAALRVRLHRGRLLGFLGDLDTATAELDRAAALAARLGDDRMRGRARLFLAELHVFVGDHAAAAPWLTEAAAAARRAGDRVSIELAAAYRRLADPEAEPAATVPDQDVPVLDATWSLAEAVVRRRHGDLDGVEAVLEHSAAATRGARVHLLLRVALVRLAGLERHATRLIAHVARRLPAGVPRRRFTTYLDRVGRFD